jgi:hypothetical protein
MGICKSSHHIDDPTFCKEELDMLFIENSKTPKPRLNLHFPRLYGHALCPYAERVRLALAAKGVMF